MPSSGERVLPGSFTTLGSPTWSAFTPTWTAATTAPVLGNGTLQGRWAQSGKLAFFHIKLTLGSTTTKGSGRWGFGGLPVGRANPLSAVSAFAEDVGGTGRWGGAAQVDGSGVFSINFGNSEVTATVPFVWAAGDLLVVQGFFESV